MMKSVCSLVHKPGSSRADFQRYYEANHAPLAARHFPFARYARNHLIGGSEFGFDTVAEFWAEDILAVAALMDGPVGVTMREDEERFMNRTRIAPAGSEEAVLSLDDPSDAAGLRTMILLEATSASGWREEVIEWASDCAAGRAGVSLDFATSWGSPPFPADAILWMQGSLAAPPPPPGISCRSAVVRRVETPAHTLAPTPSATSQGLQQ